MAERITRRETVTLESLDKTRKQQLIDVLFQLNCRIFAGGNKLEFAQRICRKEARWNRVIIYRNQAGDPVGYCGLHLIDIPGPAGDCSVIRVETGILRDYRGRGETIKRCLVEACKYKFKHPLRTLYIFCTLVHPSSYHLLQKHFFQIFPRPGKQTPPAVADRMQWLADYFGEKRIAGIDHTIRDVGWGTLDTEEEQAFWTTSCQPDIRFFLEKNPNYSKGQGLVTLVPLTLPNLLAAAASYGWQRVQTRYRPSPPAGSQP